MKAHNNVPSVWEGNSYFSVPNRRSSSEGHPNVIPRKNNWQITSLFFFFFSKEKTSILFSREANHNLQVKSAEKAFIEFNISEQAGCDGMSLF